MKFGIYAILFSVLILVSCAGSGTDDDQDTKEARFGTARFNESYFNK
jgi:hypothetical protein